MKEPVGGGRVRERCGHEESGQLSCPSEQGSKAGGPDVIASSAQRSIKYCDAKALRNNHSGNMCARISSC